MASTESGGRRYSSAAHATRNSQVLQGGEIRVEPQKNAIRINEAPHDSRGSGHLASVELPQGVADAVCHQALALGVGVQPVGHQLEVDLFVTHVRDSLTIEMVNERRAAVHVIDPAGVVSLQAGQRARDEGVDLAYGRAEGGVRLACTVTPRRAELGVRPVAWLGLGLGL